MEVVQEILAQLPIYLSAVCQVIGGIAIVATAIVQLTKSKSDDKAVSKAIRKVLKLMSYLPTIGINPNTKKLEDAAKSLEQ